MARAKRVSLRAFQTGEELIKHLAPVFAAAALLAAGNATAATDSPLTPVRQFLAAFNKGDLAGTKATHEADVAILDEVPPHIWRGPNAIDEWVASLGAYGKAHGRTGEKVTLGAPRVVTTAGDHGYVVVSALFTYADKGKPMREPATMTFAMHNGATGWKIAGWSWNGTVPQPSSKKN